MLVKDGMTSPAITVGPKTLLPEIGRLMEEKRIHQLPVVSQAGRLVGIITDRDLRDARSLGDFANWSAEAAMTEDPATLRPGDTLGDALLRLHRERFGGMPVVDEAMRVVGVFTKHDCLRVMVDFLGLDEPGSRLDIELGDPGDQLVEAAKVLREHEASVISAIVSRLRGQQKRRLYIRARTIDPTPLRRALTEAGLSLVDPAEKQEDGSP